MPVGDNLEVATAERELVIARGFDAPRRLVFAAWTNPEHMTHWWAPQGFASLSCEMDVRVGGAWRRATRSPAGTTYVVRGVYREIAAPDRLVFTFAREDATGALGHQTLVMAIFAESAGQTELTLRHSFFDTVAARDAHHIGWSACLDRFADYLAGVQSN
jgi:uncharacterized protein YndB with AHSA1/START domain